MDKTNDSKKRLGAAFAFSLFFFFRTLILLPEQFIGISIIEAKLIPSARTVTLLILLLLFSVLAAAVTVKIQKTGGEAVSFALVLLIADPLFYTLQNNCLKLSVSCLGMILILNEMREKPIVSSFITFPIFLLISAFLMPHSLFSYIPLAVTVFLLANIDKFCENAKRWLVLIPAAACTVLGAVANKLLCENVRSVYKAFRYWSFADWEQTGSSHLLMLLALPMLIFGIFYLNRYIKEQEHLKKKKPNDGKYLNLPFDMFALCYALSAAGFIFFKSEAFVTVNLILPAIMITQLLTGKSAAEKTTEIFNSGVKKHYFVSVMVLVLFGIVSYMMLDTYIQNGTILSYVIEY